MVPGLARKPLVTPQQSYLLEDDPV